ncbi:MAG: hypothetical protein KGZ88_12260 [Methylomicrobium sp.]|nr:hypothetical protein [Methylomicrobium sp.]
MNSSERLRAGLKAFPDNQQFLQHPSGLAILLERIGQLVDITGTAECSRA